MRQGNTDASEMIPVRLLLSIAIIVAIIVMIGISVPTLHIFLAEHQVEHECLFLESCLSTMLVNGAPRDVDDLTAPEGTKRIHTFSLPESLLYLCFGGDPDPDNTGALQSDLVEDGACIVYKVEGGSKHVIWLPKATPGFREGTYADAHWEIAGQGQSYIIHSGGTIALVFEYVQKDDRVYILIHGADDIP
jgi:hypothetical protein